MTIPNTCSLIEDRLREMYDSRRNRKVRYTYDELKHIFLNTDITFRQLAKECGVTHQAIAAIFNKYFKPLNIFGSGRTRRTAWTTYKVQQESFERPSEDALGRLWDALIENGLNPKRVQTAQQTGNKSRFSPVRLQVGQYIIKYRKCPECQPNTDRNSVVAYGHLNVQAHKVDDVDFNVTWFDGYWWILPLDITAGKSVFLPKGGYKNYNNQKPKIDWTQYRDRWELLK